MDMRNQRGKNVWNKIKAFFTGIASGFSKAKAWTKEYGNYLVLAFTLAIGFLIGRKSNGRASSDFNKLRDDNNKLREQIASLREQYEKLVALNQGNEQQLADLAGQLSNAEKLVGEAAKLDTGNADDLGKLRETNQQLRDWIQKYGKQFEGD